MDELKCAKHKIDLECRGGCSAHRDNWYCPECENGNASGSNELLSGAPAFVEALRILAHDNNMPLKKQEEWPDFINYELLQKQASSFTKEELNIFVAGEVSEMNALAKKYKSEMLHMFLNEVFDGSLSGYFFYD